jgi:hypothetical protein
MRKDKLTNLDISTNYADAEIWVFKSDVLAAFTYWVVQQSPYEAPDITNPLRALDAHLSEIFEPDIPKHFFYGDLNNLITESLFESIPEIEKLNHRANGREGMGFCSRYDSPAPDDDFIDLAALARNVFYMILREYITQSGAGKGGE